MAEFTWNGADADWTTAADWSPNGQPGASDGAQVNSGEAEIGSGDLGIDVVSISIGGAGTVAIADSGQTQTVGAGGVSNAGILDVDATSGGGSTLDINGTLTNSGTGTQGVFIGNAAITQAANVSADVLSNTGTITIDGGSTTATATLTLTGPGISVSTGTITMNSFGDLAVSGTLEFEGGAVDGGTLSGAGVIENTGGNGVTLNGVAIASGATYTDSNGSQATLVGTIANSGEILVDSTGGGATLNIGAAGATLSGDGDVVLAPTNNATSVITGHALVNVNNTIEGSGDIDGLTGLDNQAGGVIDANQPVSQSTPLSVFSITGFTDEGTLEATDGGVFALSSSVTQNQGGADGHIESIGAGSTFELSGATVVGGTLTDSGGGVIENLGGNASTLNGVTISAGSVYTDASNSSLTLSGTIANQGQILVNNATTGASTLNIAAAGATLTDGGTVTLSNDGSNSLTGAGGSQLINVNNTIQGSGEITGLAALDNQVGATIDADQSAPLLIFEQSSGTLTNEGIAEATSGGTLDLDFTTLIQNQGGADGAVESIGSGSIVELSAGTIVGGTLTDSNGGVIENVGGNGGTLNGVTISAGSVFTDASNSSLTLSGTIANQGQILVNNVTTGATTLYIAAAGATLTGEGTVTLSNDGSNSLTGAGGSHLVNVNNTIQGSGEITGLAALDNQVGATIDADQSSPLFIYYDSGAFTNEGLVEATSGGTFQLVSTTLTQNDNGGDGVVEASGTGSAFEISGGTIVGGTLTDSNGGVIENVGGNGGTLDGVTISSGSTYTDASNSGLTLSGTIVNQGQILVNNATTGASTLIAAASGATLTGGGTVLLSNDASNGLTATGGGSLVNVNNTIEGSGEITGIAALDNQAGATIDADQSAPLLIYYDSGAVTNEGIVEATSGGTFQLVSTTLTQNDNGGNGVVEASGTGSAFEISGGTIVGGTLTDSNGGVIENVGGNTSTLNGVTVSTGSVYTDTGNSDAALEGTIVDDGEILVNGSSSAASYLSVAASATVTLSGDGVIDLANSSNSAALNSVILGANSASNLINASDTIQGSGQITQLASLVNQTGGVIDANQSNPLVISSISGGMTNDGVLEATNGGTLHVETAITGTGELLVQASSEVDLGGATSETTAFLGQDGTLKLDTPSNYDGAISGFAVGDTLDLGNTNATTATPSANGANTTLTINLSGGGSLNYTLDGNYTGDTFTVTHSGSDSLITVSAGNAPPTLGGAVNTVGYVQAGPAVAIDNALTVTDAADPIITEATVQISGGLLTGDQLNFTNQNGINGSYNPASGVLTLTGTAGITAYQDALQSVTFSSTSANPTNDGADPTRTVTWIAGNGAVNSAPTTSTVDVTALPALGGAGNVVAYPDGGAVVPVDPVLTVTDYSSATLVGATATIGGFVAGDVLNFTAQSGITGAFANGVLTLSGTASLAAYQTALESVTFSTTNADSTPRTVSWQVNDGTDNSNVATSTVDVALSPPILSAGNTASYTQNGAASVVDTGVAVGDPSDSQLSGATVTISGGLQSGDTLNFSNQNGISGVYSGGVLTLSGTASLSAYQAALDTVTFSSTSLNPTDYGTDLTRTVTWQATSSPTSGSLTSTPVTSTIEVVGVDQPPVLANGGNAVTYTYALTGGAAQAVDAGLLVSDPDNLNLASATVSITNGLQAGDALKFTNQNGISGSYNATSGVLTLTGSSSLADYEAALESVTFSTTSANAAPRTVTWQASDGTDASNSVTSTIDVAFSPPALGSAGNTADLALGGAAATIDAGLTVSDASDADLSGATVAISSGYFSGDDLSFTSQAGISGSYANGVLTLTGTASLTAYQAVLDSVAYSSTSANPTDFGADPNRTISWQVTSTASSGSQSSAVTTSTVDVSGNDLPPALSGGGNTTTYTYTLAGGAAKTIDSGLTIADPESVDLASATVSITSGLQTGDQLNFTSQNGITGVYANGVLTLSGAASLAAYQAALQSVSFSTSNPALAARTISWQVSDGVQSSNTVTSTVDIADQAPVLSSAGNTVSYTQGGAAPVVDSGLAVADASDANLSGATVRISSGFQSGDLLTFTNQSGITGVYSNGVLTLSGAASLAAYQAALDSVTFSSASLNPTDYGADLARTVTWQITSSASSGDIISAPATSSIDVVGVDQPPALSGGGDTVTYTIGGAAQAVDAGLGVSDPDNLDLASATVKITGGFQAGDALNFVNQNGISGSYNSTTGVLTLTGSASLAAYQAALESVTFSTTSGNPAARTISWVASDGTLNSNAETSTVDIAYVPPVLSGAGNSVTYTPGGAGVAIDTALKVADQSSATLTGAAVSISSGFKSGDSLSFANQNGISGSYNSATGVLTLTGSASLAAYQAALDSVTFSSTAANPTASSRTISWQVSDQVSGGPDEVSALATSTVNIPAGGPEVIWNSKTSGSWNTASNWSPTTVPNATDEVIIQGVGSGTSSSPSPPFTVTSSQNNSAGSLDIALPVATLAITGNSTLTLGAKQASNNEGTISVAEGSTLNIGGTLDNGLTNTATLESSGSPFSSSFATIENGTIDNGNYGVISANGATNLLLKNLMIDGGGDIVAQATQAQYNEGVEPEIELDNVTMNGGVLEGGPAIDGIFLLYGFFETAAGSYSNILNGTFNDAAIEVGPSSSLTLEGDVNNSSEILVGGTGAALDISGNAQLSGPGLILLGAGNSITGAGSGASLTNRGNTIAIDGGTVGSPQMTLTNDATIESILGETSTVNTGANAIVNNGTLGTDSIVNLQTHDEQISNLVVDSAVAGTGVDVIDYGTLEFGSSVSSGQTVEFTGTPSASPPPFTGPVTGTLKLDHAESFNGTVEGLETTSATVFDDIDLADFGFAYTHITSVTGTGAAGTTTNVTLTDTLNHLTTTLHLLNQTSGEFGISTNDYTLMSSGSPLTGGTLFSVDHTPGHPNA